MDLDNGPASQLSELIRESEDWLLKRAVEYAKLRGYAAYTSTLEEAWRMSIAGLSEQLIYALRIFPGPPELSPDNDVAADPCTQFGIMEARRHRARGIELGMFLGLMKYYRQAYLELAAQQGWDDAQAQWCRFFIQRFFDRVEIGFVVDWSKHSQDVLLEELQDQNRQLANEKNRFLTVVESLGPPVVLFDAAGVPAYMNFAAAQLFGKNDTPGQDYYGNGDAGRARDWLAQELAVLKHHGTISLSFERALEHGARQSWFEVKLAPMLDVSGKYSGVTAILNDITARKQVEAERERLIVSLQKALAEVKALSGLLPICARCKNVRDDKGYWRQIEAYITEHSEAQFTHGLCPTCIKAIYPDIAAEMDAERPPGRRQADDTGLPVRP